MKTSLHFIRLFFVYALFVADMARGQSPQRVQGSIYPLTGRPDTLFLTSENYLPSERVALQTLMGILAQTKPEILRDTYGHRALVEKAGVVINQTYYNNFPGLLSHYANRLTGYILCNQKDKSTNVAISLAGVLHAVAIPADIEQTAINAGLTQLLDVRTRDEAWLLANYPDSLFSKNIATYQQSSDDRVFMMGDYSAYNKAIQFWDNSPTGPVANTVYNRMNKGATFFGWGPQEYETVEQLSQHSMMIIPSDWAPNLSTLTNIPATKDSFRQKEPIKPFEVKPNTHTVCFVISDGDNVQWLLGAHDNRDNWNNPNRAHVNLGWTISPSLTELAPIVYDKYIDNALTTPEGRNVLVAGPSGKGYYLPGRYSDADLDSASVLLNRYMKKADLRIVNIIDADDSDNDPSSYLKQDNVDALFYYSYGANYTGRHGEIDWYNDKPSIGGRYTLWGTLSSPASLAAQLNQASTNIYSEDGYSLISVHIWSRDVDDVLETISQLGPQVRVVAPDEFVWLIRKNLKDLPVGTGNGLKADYYDGYNISTFKYTQNDRNIDFDWGAGSPNTALLGNDQFSIKWTGKIQPLYSEQYTFYLTADDGVKLTINGQNIINDYNTTGLHTRTGTITLKAGQQYDFQLRYAEGAGNASVKLEWQSASQMRQIVPKAQLYSRPAASRGALTVYEDCNFAGFSAGFSIGEYKLAALVQKGIGDNTISAFNIAPGYKVVLFKNDNFNGDSIVLTANTAHMGSGWDDKVSSLKVLTNGVTNLAGSYTFKNVKSGLYLDIRGGLGGQSEGGPVQLWHGTDAANQLFTLKHLGNGRYTITAYHSAKSLDVAQSSLAENAPIWQWTALETLNQQFIAIAADSGYYKFISVLSGKAIDILNQSVAPEAGVVQQSDTGQASNRWLLTLKGSFGNGDGLTAAYYNGMAFDSLYFTRIDKKVEFDWGEGSPGGGLGVDHYSIRWTGKIEPRYSGEYTFYLTSDNGRRLWIDGQLVIDKWINDWDIEYSGKITLTAGQQYDIKIEYFEDFGGANIRFRWSSAQQGKEIVPKAQLYSVPPLTLNARMAAVAKPSIPLTLYPNPASNTVRIGFSGKQAKMSIFNSAGQEVVPARTIQPGATIDVSKLTPGVYLIQLDVDGVRVTRQLVKG